MTSLRVFSYLICHIREQDGLLLVSPFDHPQSHADSPLAPTLLLLTGTR